MQRVLGIDTGTNSLGWAVVDRNANEQGDYALIDKGVIIFEEGVNKGKESSKAAERTGHHALRTGYFRRRLRKIETLRVLIAHELCPALSEEDLHRWKVKKVYPLMQDFMAWQRTDEHEGKNPYACRHRCLHEQLNLEDVTDRFVLGRALYHLAQRRGFLSNRLESTPEKDTGDVKKGIKDLSAEMQKAGMEYLGDYFYHLYATKGNTVRLRARYTHREEHYYKEFQAICRKQQLPQSLCKALERALYFQRPLRSQRQTVGKCPFEPNKSRCALSHPAYEEFRMLQFVNNIKVVDIDAVVSPLGDRKKGKAPMRPLTTEERATAFKRFTLKSHASKSTIDFEDIAKAIAGRGQYQHISDPGERAYRFNYRMTQGFAPCRTMIALRQLFGEDYRSGIAECYTKHAHRDGSPKTQDEMVADVWNILYSVEEDKHVERWAKRYLQLSDEEAEKFAKIRLASGFANLSLTAIQKILPFLREGYLYAHAAFLANVPTIVGAQVWEEHRDTILHDINCIFSDESIRGSDGISQAIKDYLKDNWTDRPGATDCLYHPSQIEVYPDAQPNKQGVLQLGSPRTSSIRNPMAMRSLHEVRKLINFLLREGLITPQTEVHIEYARELNDSNKRAAIGRWQKVQEKLRAKAVKEVSAVLKGGTPTEMDILKYQLWEEQGGYCLYTGHQIKPLDFLCPNPLYDIEHTIPRSVGGDSTKENLTLCDRRFNREVKQTKLPTELANYEDIKERLAPWREKVGKLRKALDKARTFQGMTKKAKDDTIQRRHKLKMELDYWEGKLRRFEMTEVPEGFSLRQGIGIGLISKYAGLFLKSLFKSEHLDRNGKKVPNVRVIKSPLTAEFRRLWELQEDYEKKSRDNHVHHCIDAITIACIGAAEARDMAEFYRAEEAMRWGRSGKPHFRKPWATFTEDVKAIAQDLLVVHHTADNLNKAARRRVKGSDGKLHLSVSDSARASLHNDTYYGAIQQGDTVRYVQRCELQKVAKDKKASFNPKNIVDDVVREKVETAIQKWGSLAKALEHGIYMNEAKGIRIHKVRCYAPSTFSNLAHIRTHRDVSRHEHKRTFHVASNGNYMLAIYESKVGSRIKRSSQILSYLEATKLFKKGATRSILFPATYEGLNLKYTLTKGQMVLLLNEGEEHLDFNNKKLLAQRLFEVVGITYEVAKKRGFITLKHHQEAKPSGELQFPKGVFSSNSWRSTYMQAHTQFRALIEGRDFLISNDGKITPR